MSRLSFQRMRYILLLVVLAIAGAATLQAQRILNADGQTLAYTRIRGVLGASPETPDCSHLAFGPHITQAVDDDLKKYVFVFNIHVTPDNDRCSAFDRQRLEIKTEGSSPDYVKGFLGDSVTFRWDFKLADGFQPSTAFTHIHQIKAFDGDSGAPLITLTPRKASTNRLELIHINSSGVTTRLTSTPLAPFIGQWVEAYEKITYGSNGQYSIVLTSLDTGATLFTYSNNNLDLWRTGTTVVRPKWGIYRSLNDAVDLRDEQVRFDRFCLAKGTDDCPSAKDSPEFTLTATPASSGPVGAGGSAKFQVDTGTLRRFTGDIGLSVTGLPPGATAQFTPDTIAGGADSTTLTITTLPGTEANEYPLVVEGVSGILSHVASVPLVVSVDSTPPVTSAVISPGPNFNGWNNSNVNVLLSSADSESGASGMKQISYSTSGAQTIGSTVVSGSSVSIPVGIEGITTITFFGTDNAGNAEAPRSITVRLDQTAPAILESRTPAPNANGWNSNDVGIVFQCADTLSGLAAGSPPAPTLLSAEGANQSITGLCTDLAGNSASATVRNINIDKTAPLVTSLLTPSPNANGWNNTDVTVSVSAVDLLSGVASVSNPVLVQAEGGLQLVTGTAVDLAGLIGSASASVNVDKTAPEAFLQFDPVARDVAVFGKDSLSGVTAAAIAPTSVVSSRRNHEEAQEEHKDDEERGKNGDNDRITELRTYTVLDLAGNSLVLTARVDKTRNSISTRILSLQYQNGTVFTLPRNSQRFEWSLNRAGEFRELEEQVEVGSERNEQEIRARFEAETNQTIVRSGAERPLVKPALVPLRVTTNQGKLSPGF